MSTIFIAIEYEYTSTGIFQVARYASNDRGKLKEWANMMEDKNRELRESHLAFNPVDYGIYEVEILE